MSRRAEADEVEVVVQAAVVGAGGGCGCGRGSGGGTLALSREQSVAEWLSYPSNIRRQHIRLSGVSRGNWGNVTSPLQVKHRTGGRLMCDHVLAPCTGN